jgi:hypothetical protein
VSTLGFAGLVVTLVIGFEEPDSALLGLSAAALLAPVAGAFGHLALARELTPAEKQTWLRELTGRRALWALSGYLTSGDRREAAKTLGQHQERD